MAMQVLDLAPNPAIEEKYLFASKVLPCLGNIFYHSFLLQNGWQTGFLVYST